MKLFITAVLIFVVSGCCTINEDFIATCQDTWKIVGPEYIKYIENDAELTDATKKIRLRTAEIYSRMLETAAHDYE